MNIYDFKIKDIKGEESSMEQYKEKVLLIVNTATGCGFTPQYDGLEMLYKKYKEKGLEILDFPCNQFLGQAPGSNESIASFCQLKFGTTFKTFAKIEVNGKNEHPLYTYLKEQAPSETENEHAEGFKKKLNELSQLFIGSDIKWNFTKFLVNADGKVLKRYGPTITPEDIEKDIEDLLN